MKLIVGLGNPGDAYLTTRHNIGYLILDYLADKYKIDIKKRKFNGKYGQGEVQGEKIIFLKPEAYMNLSGEVIKKYLNFYKMTPDDILIIHDDIDMEFGKIKIVKNSGSGGHNGVKNIELLLDKKDYVRVKIGIAKDNDIDTAFYVLGKMNDIELKKIAEVQKKLFLIIEDFIELDYQKLTNKYNNK